MQLNNYFLAVCLIFTSLYTKTYCNQPVIEAQKAIAEQALTYCKETPNTYIVIVWPKGFHHLEYITKTLNHYGSIKYVQKLVFTNKDLFFLYRKLHKHMSHKSAKKYFKPYIKASLHKLYPVAALVFYTQEPLEKIVCWKKEIRDYIGQSYYSIHINDYYDPGTVEAAQALVTLHNHIKTLGTL